jgi:dCTP deaminase
VILSDNAIKNLRDSGDIVVEPWNPECLGPNSYDVHLSPHLATYVPGFMGRDPWCLDAARDNLTQEFEIPKKGLVLQPGRLYLASTVEYTETSKVLPYLDGKSSVARLGIQVHLTAGRGDVGFRGHWTMELSVVQPVRVYAGMPIAQLTYHTVTGEIERPYGTGPANRGGYSQRDPRPQASRMWKHFR